MVSWDVPFQWMLDKNKGKSFWNCQFQILFLLWKWKSAISVFLLMFLCLALLFSMSPLIDNVVKLCWCNLKTYAIYWIMKSVTDLYVQNQTFLVQFILDKKKTWEMHLHFETRQCVCVSYYYLFNLTVHNFQLILVEEI